MATPDRPRLFRPCFRSRPRVVVTSSHSNDGISHPRGRDRITRADAHRWRAHPRRWRGRELAGIACRCFGARAEIVDWRVPVLCRCVCRILTCTHRLRLCRRWRSEIIAAPLLCGARWEAAAVHLAFVERGWSPGAAADLLTMS